MEGNAPETAEKATVEASGYSKLITKNLCLRVILFLLSLTTVVVMVTSKQTKLVTTPLLPYPVYITSKYTDTPAFIYFVVALSLALSYSFITALATLWYLKKPCSSKSLFQFFLVLIANDVMMVGVVAAASGAGGCIGYIGLKGNSKVGWNKVCNIFDKFCKQIGASIFMSIVVSILFAALVVLSAYSVHRLARKASN